MNRNDHDQKPQHEQEQEPAQASNKAGVDEQGGSQANGERPLNWYEEKQEARRERLLDRANANKQASASTFERARTMASVIPFGQPILVGHHSEAADRRYRGRIDTTFRKSFELQGKAEHYEQKAAGVGTGGISSDDPNATDKLRTQLAKIEGDQARMKAANAAIRKHKTPEARIAALVEQGFSEAVASGLLKPDFAGRIGFANYMLTNNNANIRRIRARVERLEKAGERQAVEVDGERYSYREDTTENRVMFMFPGKPGVEVRALLKAEAFKWSPSRGAWVRQLTAAGRYAGERVRKTLDERHAQGLDG